MCDQIMRASHTRYNYYHGMPAPNTRDKSALKQRHTKYEDVYLFVQLNIRLPRNCKFIIASRLNNRSSCAVCAGCSHVLQAKPRDSGLTSP